MEYIEHQVAEGIKAVKYIVGNVDTDGHTHIFYLRDDLPRVTASSYIGPGETWPHAHSIEEGPDNTLVCSTVIFGSGSHTHTVFTKEGT